MASSWGWHERTDSCTEWDELQGHAVTPPQKDLLQQKASLSPSLAGTSCKQGAPCLVEVLGSHRCCRGDGLYLNLIGKCEELWATLAFSTQWPGDPVFQGVLWVLVCVLLQQMFLEHLLPARLLHALVKVVNEPQPLPWPWAVTTP